MKHTEQKHPYVWGVEISVLLRMKFRLHSRLKVTGGVIGITQNDNALKRFFLIAPELKRLCINFEKNIGVHSVANKVKHHEVQGTKSERMNKNKATFQKLIVAHGDPFLSTPNEMINLLTHAVLPDHVAEDIVNRDQVGKELFAKFVEDRLIRWGIFHHGTR